MAIFVDDVFLLVNFKIDIFVCTFIIKSYQTEGLSLSNTGCVEGIQTNMFHKALLVFVLGSFVISGTYIYPSIHWFPQNPL